MNSYDFIYLPNFSQREVELTGADPKDVDLGLMLRTQRFRELCEREVYLLKNGLTTGEHGSPMHPGGKAIDITIKDFDNSLTALQILKWAVEAGFEGIGIYHNGNAYSVHLEIGRGQRRWGGHKNKDSKEWEYYNIILDPKNFTK